MRPEKAYKQMFERSGYSFSDKVKKGDIIQSFDVTMPVDTMRGSYIGKVINIYTDGTGVEKVVFKAEMRLSNGYVQEYYKNGWEMEAPANGQPSSTGRKTDGIIKIG